MDRPLHILMLEDCESDAQLVLRELSRGGVYYEAARVYTREEFLDELECQPPDLILADYVLPSFDGLAALSLAQRACPGVPLIFVTGELGEERAIETLKRGATDYVLKDRLSRLVPAVWRAVEEAEERRRREEAEARLQKRTAELEAANAQLESHRVQLQAFSRKLVEVQEQERRALSRDLHDTSGQSITALTLRLGALKRTDGCPESIQAGLDELLQLADVVSEDLYRLAVSLRPASLDRYGLAHALEQLLAEFRKQTGLQVEFMAQGMDGYRLPAESETALYRIVQEATTNCTRYAQAACLSVVVQRRDDHVQVIVEDDGRGFDVEEALRSGRLGLLGMRERAEMLGGTIEIESSLGHGTTIYASLPVGQPTAEGSAPERSNNAWSVSPAPVANAYLIQKTRNQHHG